MWARLALCCFVFAIDTGCKQNEKSPAPDKAPAAGQSTTAKDAATATTNDAGSARAGDAAPSISCDDRFRAARKLANSKKYEEAARTFTEIKESCAGKLREDLALWLASELSFVHYKLGDKEACLSEIVAVDAEKLAKQGRIAKALLHNAKLCDPEAPDSEVCDHKLQDNAYCRLSLALEENQRAPYEGSKHVPCPFVEGAVQLAGTADLCFEVRDKPEVEGQDPYEEGAARLECPPFLLHRKVGDNVVSTEVTLPDESSLVSDCCNLDAAETVERGGQSLLILRSDGPGRDCGGGTATSDYFEVYRVDGDKLVLVKNLAIWYH